MTWASIENGRKHSMVKSLCWVLEMVSSCFQPTITSLSYCWGPTLHINGDFQTCLHLFYQVFTLHAFKHRQQFPHLLLPGKTNAGYNTSFILLKETAGWNSGSTFYFEIARNSELLFAFPKLKEGWYFHYTQAIWRKVHINLRFQKLYGRC